MRIALGLGLVLLCGCGGLSGESPTSGRLSVAAAESHAPLAGREAALFNSLYEQAHVGVLPTTTREAFIALLDDSVQAIVVDRPANDEERQAMAHARRDFEAVRIAEDALALVVHPSNALPNLTRDQATELLCGRVGDWGQLPGSGVTGPIETVITGRNSGAWELLAQKFFAGRELTPPSVLAATQRDVLVRVAADPRAIGIASVAAWKNLEAEQTTPEMRVAAAPGWASGVAVSAAHLGVRALAFASTDSLGQPVVQALHQANIHLGVYPLHYPVYVYFDKKSLLAAGFSAFVASAPGQKLILDAGLVPATMPVRIVQID